MPLFGAHFSIAGGHHQALFEAQRRGCDTVQLFTKSPSQWSAFAKGATGLAPAVRAAGTSPAALAPAMFPLMANVQ